MSLSLAGSPAFASPAPFAQTEVERHVDSGFVGAFRTVVSVPGAAWIRLAFDEVVLGEAAPGGAPTALVLTSLRDGAVQHHRAETLAQWGNTSAYFNGDSVRVEVAAGPGAAPSRVVIATAQAGSVQVGGFGICGDDDREPSGDPRVCRTAPNGCTAFMISDYANCMLTAGHCNLNFALVEFNVPPSNPDGTINHPGPQDQYAVDQSSIQVGFTGIGNDWCYFGCFPNTETGLRPFEVQGAALELAAVPPPPAGQAARVTGYGLDPGDLGWSQAQQASAGPYVAFFGTTVQVLADSLSGGSGSPIVDETSGKAFGILTNGGCIGNAGANSGTASSHGVLKAALANPLGVCLPTPPVAFEFPNGLPSVVHSSSVPIRVEVTGANGGSPAPGTGMLHYDAGGGFIAVDMVQVAPGVYDAVFPALECFLPVSYYFSAQSVSGETVHSPLLAPSQHHRAIVATGSVVQDLSGSDSGASDSFGWAVAIDGDLAVAGAFQDDDNGADAGAAYVLRRRGGAWVEEQKLLASDGSPGDNFGFAVAAGAGAILIGASLDDDDGNASGSLYAFRHDGSSWVEEQKLLPSDGAAGVVFGARVAMSGGVAIVGALGADDQGSDSGAAYVFRQVGSTWVEEQKLLAGGGTADDLFGNAVAIDGDVAIVGAYAADGAVPGAGAAYVFRRSGSTWTEEQKLVAADGAASDYFGYSVAIDGSLALVGASGDDDATTNAGSVHEFLHDGSTWSAGARLLASIATPNDGLGGAIALSGPMAVIGASHAATPISAAGAAFAFRRSSRAWLETQVLTDLQGGGANDAFGISVAAEGGTALVGAWRDNHAAIDSGSVTFFETLCSACPWDPDRDGAVGIREFLALLEAWGTSPGAPPDLDGDGMVGSGDLDALLNAWGRCG